MNTACINVLYDSPMPLAVSISYQNDVLSAIDVDVVWY